MNITLEEYKAEILRIATDIIDEYKDDNFDCEDIFDYVIREWLDHQEWLTLADYSGEVAKLSDNREAYLELGSEILGLTLVDEGIVVLITLIDYYAMQADITQSVKKNA
jgi:hypothetical protein